MDALAEEIRQLKAGCLCHEVAIEAQLKTKGLKSSEINHHEAFGTYVMLMTSGGGREGAEVAALEKPAVQCEA